MTVIFDDDDEDYQYFRDNYLNSRQLNYESTLMTMSSPTTSIKHTGSRLQSERQQVQVSLIRNEKVTSTQDAFLKYSIQVVDSDDQYYSFENAQLSLKTPPFGPKKPHFTLFTAQIRYILSLIYLNSRFVNVTIRSSLISLSDKTQLFSLMGKLSFWRNFSSLLKWLESKMFLN